MRRTKNRFEALTVPNPVMDLVLTTVCVMLLIFSLKVLPTPAAPPPPSVSTGDLTQRLANQDADKRAEAVRAKFRDRFLGLPPLNGYVALMVDVSRSIGRDGLEPVEASIVASLILNYKEITHLRAIVFNSELKEVCGWVHLDAANNLPANQQNDIAQWLQTNLGASKEAAGALARTQRPLVLRKLLSSMNNPDGGTNLVGAIKEAVSIAGGQGAATAVILTDGVHSVWSGPRPGCPENEILAVHELLETALKDLPKRGGPLPTVHAIALLGEPAWSGKDNRGIPQPQAEAIVGMLRSLTAQFNGTVLALPCKPGDWSEVKGLHVLSQGGSPIPDLQNPADERDRFFKGIGH